MLIHLQRWGSAKITQRCCNRTVAQHVTQKKMKIQNANLNVSNGICACSHSHSQTSRPWHSTVFQENPSTMPWKSSSWRKHNKNALRYSLSMGFPWWLERGAGKHNVWAHTISPAVKHYELWHIDQARQQWAIGTLLWRPGIQRVGASHMSSCKESTATNSCYSLVHAFPKEKTWTSRHWTAQANMFFSVLCSCLPFGVNHPSGFMGKSRA